jgi:hypothetical protein
MSIIYQSKNLNIPYIDLYLWNLDIQFCLGYDGADNQIHDL